MMHIGFKGEKIKLWFYSSLSHSYGIKGQMSADENDIIKAISDYNKIYKQSEHVITAFKYLFKQHHVHAG